MCALTADRETWQLGRLRSALRLLAADPHTQHAELRRIGTLPELDELALEWDDIRGTLPGLVRTGAVPQVLTELAARIEDAFAQMDGKPELWQSDAIELPQWETLREIARRALTLLGREGPAPDGG